VKFKQILSNFFLPRDAMRKRGLCCRRVSVTFMYFIQTVQDIVKLLSRSGSLIILVPFFQALGQNAKGDLFSGVLNTQGWEKVCDLRLK